MYHSPWHLLADTAQFDTMQREIAERCIRLTADQDVSRLTNTLPSDLDYQ